MNEMLLRCLQDEDDDVEVQSLPISIVRATKSKRGTQITFQTPNTSVEEIVSNSGRIGVILWIPRDMWKKHQGPRLSGSPVQALAAMKGEVEK